MKQDPPERSCSLSSTYIASCSYPINKNIPIALGQCFTNSATQNIDPPRVSLKTVLCLNMICKPSKTQPIGGDSECIQKDSEKLCCEDVQLSG